VGEEPALDERPQVTPFVQQEMKNRCVVIRKPHKKENQEDQETCAH
jgi:hypothetical protein